MRTDQREDATYLEHSENGDECQKFVVTAQFADAPGSSIGLSDDLEPKSGADIPSEEDLDGDSRHAGLKQGTVRIRPDRSRGYTYEKHHCIGKLKELEAFTIIENRLWTYELYILKRLV